MKKLVMLLVLALTFLMAGAANAQTEERVVILKIGDNQALIDNKPVALSSPAMEVEGRTLVPLRFVGEAFGCTVDWKNDAQKAVVSLGDQIVEVTIGKQTALINGNDTPLQVPARLSNDRTYVPLRFIGETLGADINWDAAEQKITMTIKAYYSDKFKFKAILPPGWSVKEETDEDISFNISGIAECHIIRFTEINEDSYTHFVNEMFDQYKTKENLADVRDGNLSHYIFKDTDEDTKTDLIIINSVKLTDEGVLFVGAVYPEKAFNKSLADKYYVMVNTLSEL